MIVGEGRGARVVISIALMFGSGCVSGPSSAPPAVARQISPELQRARDAAEEQYRACLAAAAKFADDGRTAPANLALVTAPMCYSQFSELEGLLTAGLTSDERRTLDRDGDQRQIDFAREAIKQERDRTAVAASR
jgi:hypothetical protein